MDKINATNYLQEFLDGNPNLKPTGSFKLSEPTEQSVNNEIFYYFCWAEQDGRNARGGYSYYVMPDGQVVLPNGGSGQPETAESVYSRWQSQK